MDNNPSTIIQHQTEQRNLLCFFENNIIKMQIKYKRNKTNVRYRLTNKMESYIIKENKRSFGFWGG